MPNDSKPYDVFLSYSRLDAELVEHLARQLEKKHGLKVWLDLWELAAGQFWQEGMADGLERASSCVVCIGAQNPAGWFGQEVQVALNRRSSAQGFPVIPTILPGGDPDAVRDFLRLRTWVDLRSGIDDQRQMRALVNGIRRLPPGRDEEEEEERRPLFTVPIADNPFFTERGNELAELEQTLKKRGIAALTGMGGMGKTQTAAKYAYLHREEYPAVLWVRAENQETLYADFSRLAKQLGLEEADAQEQKLVVEAVKRWLDDQPRWLLVLDNVVDLKFVSDLTCKANVRDRLIIVTTQSKVTGAIQRNELSTMEPAEGDLLLLRRANFIGPDAPLTDAAAEDVEAGEAISEKLGGLPLAVDQAGAYISETSCGLADYRELLNDSLPQLLSLRGDLDNEHESVAKTVVKSMQELAKRNPAAADLVTAAAFLAPDAIPEEIFTEGASKFSEPLRTSALDKLAWNQVIGATLKFSLLDRDPKQKTLSVHRTVQVVVRWNMEDDERRACAEHVVRAMDMVFPSGEFGTWGGCERLLPHAQACASLIGELDIPIREAAQLLNQIAVYLYNRARNAEIERLFRGALKIDQKIYGSDHPEVAIDLNNLAMFLQDANRLDEAELRFRRALEIDEKVYGPDHPDVAIRLNNLSRLLLDTNRFGEAELLIHRAIAIWENASVPEHSRLSSGLNSLARFMQLTGRPTEAEPLYRRALEVDENSLGPEHPDVAIDLSNLATLLQAANRLDEAEPLMRRSLDITEKSLGHDHPNTVTFRQNLEALLRVRAADS